MPSSGFPGANTRYGYQSRGVQSGHLRDSPGVPLPFRRGPRNLEDRKTHHEQNLVALAELSGLYALKRLQFLNCRILPTSNMFNAALPSRGHFTSTRVEYARALSVHHSRMI